MPIGGELNPVASVRAEFLTGNVGRGDRPAFVGKGSCDRERNEPYGSDPDIADERLHSALTDCCNDSIRLFQPIKKPDAAAPGLARVDQRQRSGEHVRRSEALRQRKGKTAGLRRALGWGAGKGRGEKIAMRVKRVNSQNWRGRQDPHDEWRGDKANCENEEIQQSPRAS
jgi:hypothetical protein